MATLQYPSLDLLDSPWTCEGHTYRTVRDTLQRFEENGPPPANPDFVPQLVEIQDGIAIIPIRGILLPRQNLFSAIYDFSTLDILELQLSLAMSNDAVKQIVLDIDSPGGSAQGIAHLAGLIAGFAKHKQLYAFCWRAQSGAFWLASACQFVIASDETAEIGSIGAIIEIVNREKQAEMNGETFSIFSTGVLKTSGHPYQRMSGEQTQYLQDKALDLGLMFAGAVELYRPRVNLEEVVSGASYFALGAIEYGLIDDIMPVDRFIEFLTNLQRGSTS